MVRLRNAVHLCLAVLALSGCQSKDLSWTFSSSSLRFHIQGSVEPIAQNGTFKVRAPSSKIFGSVGAFCTSPTVRLYPLSPEGKKVLPAIATAAVSDDGSYSLSVDSNAHSPPGSDGISYFIEVTGCSEVISRPVTGLTNQNVNYGTATIGFLVGSDVGANLADATPGAIEQVMGLMAAAGSYADSKILLNTDVDVQTAVQNTFGISAPSVLDLPPQILDISIPANFAELQSQNMSITYHHIDPAYTPAFQWLADDTEVSTTPTAAWTPGANSQGLRTITIKTGQDNAGEIDTGVPVNSESYSVTVANTVPPAVPAVTLDGGPTSAISNSVNINLNLNTGVGLANCASFSSLAITENDVLLPAADEFDIACTDDGNQAVPYTLSLGDGVKTLRVWAIDRAGNVSSAPQIVTVTIDQGMPTASVTLIGPLKGGTSASVAFTAVDAASGLNVVKLWYAANGSTFTEVGLLTGSPYAWSVPADNTTSAKLMITAEDLAGNTFSAYTSTFVIDSTAPALTYSSPTANTEAKTSLTITGTCESGLPVVINGAGAGATDASCSGGTFSQSVNFSAGDGSKTIDLTQTDGVGNSTTVSRVFLRDNVAPALNTTSPGAGSLHVNSLTLSGTCESGAGDVTISGTGVAFSSSTSCTTNTFSTSVGLSAGDGSKVLNASQTDNAGNTGSAALTVIRDATAPALTVTSPAENSPFKYGTSISGTCESGLTVTLGGDITSGQSVSCSSGTFSAVVTFSAGDGTKTLSLAQTDPAGNVGTLSYDLVRDSLQPELSISSPSVNARAQTGVTITGVCLSGYDVDISGTGIAAPIAASCASGSFSQAVTFTAGEGTKAVTVEQTDGAMNTTTVNRDFVRDNTSPSVSFTSPAASSATDAGVTVNGTCETGSGNITLTSAALASSTTATCTAGAFTKILTLIPPDGTITVSATQTDEAGNVGNGSLSLALDTTAPLLLLVTPTDGDSAQTSLTLNGTCETGLIVSATGVGISGTPSTICASASFTLNLSLSAGEGTKAVTLTETDAVGNTSTLNLDFTRDNTAPTFTQTTLAATVYSNTNTVTYGGACETGLSVDITGAQTATAACSGGTWTYATSKSVDGSYAYTFAQTDLAGNTTSASATWVRDATLPALSLTAPAGGTLHKGGTTMNLSWSGSDANSAATPVTLEYSGNGGTSWSTIVANQAASGSYTWTLPSLNSSTVFVRAKFVDLATNIRTASNASAIVIDSSAPVVNLTSLTGGQTLKGGSTYAITWSATDNNFGANPIALDYSLDGGSTWSAIAASTGNSGTYNWTPTGLNSQQLRVRVTAMDSLSQTANSASSSNLIVDSGNPTLSLNSPASGQIIKGDNGFAITWTATDANFGSTPITVAYSANSGSTWTNLAANAANSGSYTWNVSPADGTTYRVRVIASDLAGNSTTASTGDFTITRLGPALTQTGTSSYTVNAGNSVTFSGACDLSASMSVTTVTITGSDSASVSCSGSAPSGTWTWTTPSKSSDGTYTYTFAQTNGASITTEIGATWVRDTSVPQVTAVMINDGATYAPSILVAVRVTISDSPSLAGMQVRVATTTTGGDCQALYADDNWQSQTSATTAVSAIIPSGNGAKKVCAWAKDQAGNVSSISPATGTAGVDMDEISLSDASPPVITAFTLINNAGGPNQGTSNHTVGDPILMTWTATSTLSLLSSPIKLEYTTDNVIWNPIENAYGSATGTSYTDSYYGFNAPTSGYFRVRISATDEAGNTSSTAQSPAQNTGNWEVFAGTTDRGWGGSAKTAKIGLTQGIDSFAVAPNNDVYIVDNGRALLKVDALTNRTSVVIGHGTNNLPSNGTLPASPKADMSSASVGFDRNGLFYLLTGSSTSNGSKIYRIDLTTQQVKLYLGGGMTIDNTATPSTVFVTLSPISFDESNTMYFWTNCTPNSTPNQTTRNVRMMKATQNADGTAGTVSVVAGNCQRGTYTPGELASTQPLVATGNSSEFESNKIVAWNNGAVIYFNVFGAGGRKIINGKLFDTTIGVSSGIVPTLTYNPVDQKLYVGGSSLRKYTPVLTETNLGEVSGGTLVSSAGTADDCNQDGKAAASACAYVTGSAHFLSNGTLLFKDGQRIRYVDSNQTMRTFAGILAFYGAELDKSLARGNFSGIYYKKSTELNQTAFPEGLYFIESGGPIFGRFDTDGTTRHLWGTQRALSASTLANGTLIGPTVDMNLAQSTTTRAMTFDDDGLPWMEYAERIVSIDADNKYVARSNAYLSDIASAVPGNSPSGVGAGKYAYFQNLTMKGKATFALGRWYNPPEGFMNPDPKLRLMDYANNIIVHLMGNGGTTSTPDSTVAGSLENSDIDGYCTGVNCSVQFMEGDPAITSDDVLYWSEGKLFRKIQDPTTPANHFLTTLFTAGSNIENFTVRPDQSQVFYTRYGHVRCHALTPDGIKSWCNDASLGPTTGLSSITRGSNQFTWIDNDTLLVSTYAGEIYKYTIPTTP